LRTLHAIDLESVTVEDAGWPRGGDGCIRRGLGFFRQFVLQPDARL
jgi:hypothetical protein